VMHLGGWTDWRGKMFWKMETGSRWSAECFVSEKTDVRL
jgi:hypothetical protein